MFTNNRFEKHQIYKYLYGIDALAAYPHFAYLNIQTQSASKYISVIYDSLRRQK